MFNWKRKQLTKEEYLMKLSLEEREQLKFYGYVFEVKMVSGEVHVLKPYYIRGFHNEYQQLDVLKKGRDVCYSNKDIEVSCVHIESLKMLKENGNYYIGKRAWESISFKICGERVSIGGKSIIAEGYLFKLLMMDEEVSNEKRK